MALSVNVKKIGRQITFGAGLLWALTAGVSAQSLLRDAETEKFFKDTTTPIFEAAGLDPNSVKMYLLGSQQLNAFVTGGQNIFIFSGLILATDTSDEFIGVMAHETCHIACSHKLRRQEAAGNFSPISIASLVLGALAIAAGSPDAGLGLIFGGQQIANGQFLAYTRGQEAEADITGARYLAAAGYSADGLIRFFSKLRGQELYARVPQIPYFRSHPLNSTRIQNLTQLAKNNPRSGLGPIVEIEERYQRIKAKLAGYLYESHITLNLYPESNQSVAAQYARVYAYHKANEWDKALSTIEQLIKLEPENPYFREIKGQVLFESGNMELALATLRQAVQLAPGEPLILTALGQALVTDEQEKSLKEAVPLLKRATLLDETNTFAWFNLARAYGYQGLEAEANLATAERYYSIGQGGQAVVHARRAMQGFERFSPGWIRAQDILVASEELIRRFQNSSRRGLAQPELPATYDDHHH